jgi:hypothetical protein
MACSQRSPLRCLCFLGLLAAGCCPPAAIYVETTIHPDGSCDRMTWQPKDKFLPEQAKKPEWRARWKEVSDAGRPPVALDRKPSSDDCHYFIARGSFKNPREIPSHYRFTDANVPEAGASELERTYETMDYGFVVEHRWREKITNIVTLAGFLKARDELLDTFLPPYTEAVEKVFGNEYDVSRAVAFLRTDVRRFLEQASLILYDAAVRGKVMDERRQLDPAMCKNLSDAAERCGIDPKWLVDAFALPANDKEKTQAEKRMCGPLVVKYFRHRDGRMLTLAEADALVHAVLVEHRYEKELEQQMKRFEEALQKDEQLKKRAGRAFLQMVGLYGGFQFLFAGGSPRYEFALALPGELVETNGTGTQAGRTRWKFTGDELYPSGYEMRARSVVIDRDAQKKTLGRVVIDDVARAQRFIEIVSQEGPLLEAVRKLHQTGDRKAMSDVKASSYEETLRVRKLRGMLFGE